MLYPQKLSSKKSNLIIKSLLIVSIIIAILLVIINKLTTPEIHWAALANSGIIYTWLTVLYSINKNTNIAAHVMIQTIAISIYDKKEKDASLICAKAADELLTISNITASFVLGNIGDKICISGRSIGDINVQIILEKLGGGGHITLAGAQLEGLTMEEAKQELIIRINEYFTEIE